jgi:hypothetical protein
MAGDHLKNILMTTLHLIHKDIVHVTSLFVYQCKGECYNTLSEVTNSINFVILVLFRKEGNSTLACLFYVEIFVVSLWCIKSSFIEEVKNCM